MGARHLQPGQGQGQPDARDHGHGQQADRRRLVRPRRLRPGPPRRSSKGSSGASSTRWRSSRQEAKRQKVAELMAAGYNIPAPDALGMLGDAHSTNWAENFQFFLNQNNPTNFERIWQQCLLPLPADRRDRHQPIAVRPGDGLLGPPEAGGEAKYASQKDEYGIQFAPRSRPARCRAERERSSPTRSSSTSSQLAGTSIKKVTRTVNGKESRSCTTPTCDRPRGDRQARRPVRRGPDRDRGAHRRLDEGPDSHEPRQGALAQPGQRDQGSAVRKFPTSTPTSSPSAGLGPAGDDSDPENHTKNRRVEVKVYPAEAGTAK